MLNNTETRQNLNVVLDGKIVELWPLSLYSLDNFFIIPKGILIGSIKEKRKNKIVEKKVLKGTSKKVF